MEKQQHFQSQVGIVIHGGAGTIRKHALTPEKELALRQALHKALEAGFNALSTGGSALDAVQLAVRCMEDSPEFNAGFGAVFTAAEQHELDASIMEGGSKKAGAVAGLTTVKNPIDAARAVMDNSEHVLLISNGADEFARANNLEIVDNTYFSTSERRETLQRVQQAAKQGKQASAHEKHGTVGAVAVDMNGNVAAATSTGGMTNKTPGRVGDSPLIGAGCYADNATCAISCTGHGEFYIRLATAYDISARMKYGGLSLSAATELALHQIELLGGEGGVIGITASGESVAAFNSAGMYRGWHFVGSVPVVRLFSEQEEAEVTPVSQAQGE